jgi:polar amino acid transport system substrate-binding protein
MPDRDVSVLRRVSDMGCGRTLGLAAAMLVLAVPALPRSLQSILDRNTLTMCASPNALPFASRTGEMPGFQIELGEKLAERLGVTLSRQWVMSAIQARRADCDIVLDTIADKVALEDSGLRPSRPYHRSGVVLAVRDLQAIPSLEALGPGKRVGVQVGSLASMTLAKRGIATTPFVFESEMMAALGASEIDAAAVTPASIGWHNLTQPQSRFASIEAFADQPDLNWNVAVGMIRPDDKLRQAIDAALEALLADGSIARIYARYGVTLRPPQ